MGVIEDIIKKKYGVTVSYEINRLTDVINTTKTKITSNNSNRLALTIINLGSYDCYIAPNPNITIGKGILLVANGGGISFSVEEDFILPSLEFWGISEVDTNSIFVLEVIAI